MITFIHDVLFNNVEKNGDEWLSLFEKPIYGVHPTPHIQSTINYAYSGSVSVNEDKEVITVESTREISLHANRLSFGEWTILLHSLEKEGWEVTTTLASEEQVKSGKAFTYKVDRIIGNCLYYSSLPTYKYFIFWLPEVQRFGILRWFGKRLEDLEAGHEQDKDDLFEEDRLWKVISEKAKGVVAGTTFEGLSSLYDVLKYRMDNRHTITIDFNVYEDLKYKLDIEAYEITQAEWTAIKQLINHEREWGSNEEGEEFDTEIFPRADDIKIRNCYAGEYISSNDDITGNCYSEDCDTNGSIMGAKAVRNYIFWIKDKNMYAVVYFSYWCL